MLSIIMPTRGRSQQAFKCVQRILEVTKDIDFEIVISSHPDLETVQLFGSLADPRVKTHFAEHDNGIQAWNHAASLSQGDFLTVSDDDLWYNENWYVEAMRLLDPNEIMYVGIGEFGKGQDSQWGEWPERAVGTRRFFKEIIGGVLCVPHYKSHHDDVEKSDKAHIHNCIHKVDGNIEHRHYCRHSGAQRDETNARAERWYGEDLQTYIRRKAAGFPLDYQGVF